MARVTIEDCLQRFDNRFGLVHLTAQRVRQLKEGATPHLVSKNKYAVLALREIAAGNVHSVDPGEADKDRAEAEAREAERLAQAQAEAAAAKEQS